MVENPRIIEGWSALEKTGIVDQERSKGSPTLRKFERFYNDGREVSFFTDYSPSLISPVEKFNNNALQAAKMVVDIIRNSDQGGVGMVSGPMASSKTSLGVKLTEKFPQLQFFQHKDDEQRFDSDFVTTQAGGGWETEVYRKGYTTISDLMGGDGIRFGQGEVVFVDEFGFVNKNKDDDPPEMNMLDFGELVGKVKRTGTKLILSLLDFDFAGRPWPNALVVNWNADLFRVVLASRCVDNCGRPSFLTQRNTVLPDGRVRPSHSGEEVFQVGSVVNTYQPKCFEGHKVFSPDEAVLFDSGG